MEMGSLSVWDIIQFWKPTCNSPLMPEGESLEPQMNAYEGSMKTKSIVGVGTGKMESRYHPHLILLVYACSASAQTQSVGSRTLFSWSDGIVFGSRLWNYKV